MLEILHFIFLFGAMDRNWNLTSTKHTVSHCDTPQSQSQILLLRFYFIFNCMYVCLCGHAHMGIGVLRDQKRALDPLELELQVVVSYLT